jgi:hypothetical protein
MAELVWDDEAGEWVYPEDDGSEELEDTPGEARWRQEQQDARERDIRRRNALAGNPDPRYAEEFLDLYPPEDPQTETGTGTPGTPGNQNEPPPMPPPPTPPTPPTPTTPTTPTNTDTPDPGNIGSYAQLLAKTRLTILKADWMTLGQTLKAFSLTLLTATTPRARRTCSGRPSPETSSERSLEGTVLRADTTPTGTTKTRRVLAGETRQRDTHARWDV